MSVFTPTLGFCRDASECRPRRTGSYFNPVLGFFPRRNSIRHRGSSSHPAPFQSHLGFSTRRDTNTAESTTYRGRGSFNPVLGFLPVVTPFVAAVATFPSRFNPVLGFLPVVTCSGKSPKRGLMQFQSRLGFSPRRDCSAKNRPGSQSFNPVLGFLPVVTFVRSTMSRKIDLFQSRLGFSPRRDRHLRRVRRAPDQKVSIPSRVFSPS